jgi:hypothetical protein
LRAEKRYGRLGCQQQPQNVQIEMLVKMLLGDVFDRRKFIEIALPPFPVISATTRSAPSLLDELPFRSLVLFDT